MNFQSAGKIKKIDGETQNENAATAKEKKPDSGTFSKFFSHQKCQWQLCNF